MIYNIFNLPKHIDVEYDVDGILYKVYLYPETGTFEVARLNVAKGLFDVIDEVAGFFDPLDITDYDYSFGPDQLVCFEYQFALEQAIETLEYALVEMGEKYDGSGIIVHRIQIYGGDYEEPDCDEFSEEYEDRFDYEGMDYW